MMRVEIDGTPVDVPSAGTTVLEAVHRAGASVPTLCFDERLAPLGACRVCMVGVEGAPAPVAACTTPCRDGMRVDTGDATARRIAAATVELVLSELPAPPAPHTQLAAVAHALGVRGDELRWPGEQHAPDHDKRHPYLALRHELCISCGRCVRACDELQGAFALTATGRGFHANVAAGLDAGFRDSTCVSCGACADTCPTGAITEISLLAMIGGSG
jgi:predicted molibdopterin-dependent oxidoreductase YjgC